MFINLFSLIERIKNKWLRYYRIKAFEAYTNQNTRDCRILGSITLINRNVRIGNNVTFYPGVMLFGDGLIDIGDNVTIGAYTIIYAKMGGGCKIGSNTMIAAHSYIIDSNHGTAPDMLMREQPLSTEAVIIGQDVWIAANSKVIKGARIGNGAVIGAGSIVNRPIEENMIAFGSLAKAYRRR